ncbi:hypothetical protein G6011_00918 [Alternaria panax]|uniref:Uncharacterized protein n=1 Tax=Alternaria panax TaxID=48097 RepID=A0AAD4IJN3_9PLEO|nr:hypothetical protein G6011_00918 [Alternaria panax]
MSYINLLTSTTMLLASTIAALDLPDNRGLRTDQSRKDVLQIAFNNPGSQINFWGGDAIRGLTDIVQKVKDDTETKAVIFTSSNLLASDVKLYLGENVPLFYNPSVAEELWNKC